MRSKVLGVNFLALSLMVVACGGRSFPGSQDDIEELFPVGNNAGNSSNSTGGTGGSSGTNTGGSNVGGTNVGGGNIGGSNIGGKGGGNTGSGGVAGKAGSAGKAGGGGSPVGACGSCVADLGPEVCSSSFQNCINDTTCAALNACAISNGCLEGGQGAIAQCINQNCKSFANAFGEYFPYVSCTACSCGECNIACNPGGTGGAGGAVGVCGNCLLEAEKDGVCPFEQATCEKTKGCGEFGECLLSAGCLDKPNPQQCGQQAGCNASQQARQAFRDLSTCLACDACQGNCAVPPNQCAGGSGGTGAGGGTLEEQCVACQEGAFEVCQDSYYACVDNPACNQMLNCFQGCPENDDFCYQQCFDQNPDGQQGYYNLYYCYFCTACGDSCGQLTPDLCNSPGF